MRCLPNYNQQSLNLQPPSNTMPYIGTFSITRFIFLALMILLNQYAFGESLNSPSDSDSNYENTHIFTNYGNVQSSQQQEILFREKSPLPFSIFGSVQKWTTGPSQDNLYTQMAQGLYKINDQWKVIASELYQKQGNINLTNTILGFNYLPDKDWSINASAGMGTGDSYTYKYSLLFSPQYKLPIFDNGRKVLSAEATINYQEFSLGNFTQVVPKINWQASQYMPPISIGYAFGNFQNSTSNTVNQYYAPKTLNGAMISASIQATERSFLIISYYPYNKNLTGGRTITQDTVGATLNYKIADKFHIALFGQYQNARNASIDLAFGGSLNFAF
ncbi:hypothetical protein ICN48_12870 [Polynucleobacter sp. JS-Safj-400b-B2]|uniref:hypothetical protein n=1 Tax=Polynucleobacter sp. JS-Safj-400b-B2 TaxID=2576921 RepID=UPI001C0C4A13|nr:hypothetical protein [Polynucleobacter sp. JS-Safj-400b-B2]MBU3627121.1 hypothetical protein [Polynucleobacter sp. JS-Safj-400b-B2]